MRRPPSYSEGHIHVPKSLTKSMPSHTALPLLQEVPSTLGLAISPPPSPPDIKPFELESTPPKQATLAAHPALTWTTQFTMHLMLISLFETVFFWLFVSKSEDTALTSLVNNYVGGILNSCTNMTQPQRTALVEIFNALVNVTAVNQEGFLATQDRTAFNNILLRNSWLYFGGLSTLLTVLAGTAAVMKRPLPWRHMTVENLGMVTLLGLYEWMFFRTIVYQYKSVSISELDQMVTNEFVTECAAPYRV
jgi:hypothetical protein